MNWSARIFLPNRINGQMAILIVASLVAIHIVVTASLFWNRSGLDRPASQSRQPQPAELVTVIRMIAAVPQGARAQVLAGVANALPSIGLRQGAADGGAERFDPRLDYLRRDLGTDFRIAAIAEKSQPGREQHAAFVIGLPDGDSVIVRVAPELGPPRFAGPLIVTLLFVVISVTFLAFWAARSLTRPLSGFAIAAEGFAPDDDIVPIPERGPVEVRAAARALNKMRERIKKLVQDRTRMLAAMGHDLRTPITRMRLRCEFLQDPALRDQMLRDLDQMKAMIDAALSYLRDGSREEMTRVDAATLLQSICDEFADAGHGVSYSGPSHVAIDAHPDNLQRAIRNLVDNAIRYGGRAAVRLSLLASSIRIEVEDNGPGISDADKTAMLEPFVRGDAARSMNDSHGFGLGLAIARGIAETHHGTLTLHDGRPSGLIARIELPYVA